MYGVKAMGRAVPCNKPRAVSMNLVGKNMSEVKKATSLMARQNKIVEQARRRKSK
jgi:hypothetical protein